ncbi:MAG: adenylate/guanylate cyclase domain-containing protein [Thermoflexales bacterium]|nr:adenylate/guanylate cyclase domain-containing protein [Thermoflexales bacterium]
MRRSLFGFIIGALTGLLVSLAADYDLFPTWTGRVGDLFHIPGGARSPVAIVAVDAEALQQYGRPDEWSPEQYAALFQRAYEARARVVALDFPLSPSVEGALSATLPNGLMIWPAIGVGTPSLQDGWITFPYLLRPTSEAKIIGHINLLPDPDGVLRRFPLWIRSGTEAVPALAWRAAALYLQAAIPPPTNSPFRWAGFTLTPDRGGQVQIRYPARPGSVPMYSLRTFLEGDLPPETLTGRILFVGVTAGEGAEVYRTPVGEMTGVEVQAQVATALLAGSVLTPASFSLTALIILAASIGSGMAVARIRPLILLAVILVTIFGSILALTVAGISQGQKIDPFYPLVGMVLTSFVAGLWRSHDERQRRARLALLLQGRASPRLIARLVETPDGERLLNTDVRFVVALFADVRGFVRLTEGQDPRMVREAASHHLSCFTDAVMESGGIVTKYVGDMVAAIFNAPLPMDRPVDQALRAAQDGLKRLEKLWRERPSMMRMPMGVGVHAGTAVVGLLGSSQHPEYDAIGDTVNIAARLSTYAPAGEIYVTEAVVASAGKEWAFEPLGVVQVRGRYEPVLAYRLRMEG